MQSGRALRRSRTLRAPLRVEVARLFFLVHPRLPIEIRLCSSCSMAPQLLQDPAVLPKHSLPLSIKDPHQLVRFFSSACKGSGIAESLRASEQSAGALSGAGLPVLLARSLTHAKPRLRSHEPLAGGQDVHDFQRACTKLLSQRARRSTENVRPRQD